MLSFRCGFVECGRGDCHLGREGEVHEGMNFDSRIDGGVEHVAGGWGGVLGVGRVWAWGECRAVGMVRDNPWVDSRD